MKTVLINGSGPVGRTLSGILQSNGHCAISAGLAPGANALAGVSVVVDLGIPPWFADDEAAAFLEQTTGRLLSHAAVAGVSHYVVLSVVGAERVLSSGHMRARRQQELMVSHSGLPWSIVRATQLYECLGAIAEAGACGDDIYLSPVEFQPMAARDVAGALAELVMARPLCSVREIAGPKRYSMAKLVQCFLKRSNDPRAVIPDYEAPYLGALLDHQSLVPAQPSYLGSTDFETWLAETTSRGEES